MCDGIGWWAETTLMRVHTVDAHGVSRAAFYDGVEVGDVVSRAAKGCFVRYRLTSTADSATATRPPPVRIPARAHQHLVWDRTCLTNRLRNVLRNYFPGALQAFLGLAHGDAVGVLAAAPGPREAPQLTMSQIRAAVRRRWPQAQRRGRAAPVAHRDRRRHRRHRRHRGRLQHGAASACGSSAR